MSNGITKLKASSKRNKFPDENVAPSGNNLLPLYPKPPIPVTTKRKCTQLLRHPPNVPAKQKVGFDAVSDCPVPFSNVKVVVRIRPLIKEEEKEKAIFQKISDDSLSYEGHSFTFDAVTDTDSSQLDIFQLVGAPLVENCLAGFNSSVFAYGQTGSGKTYTMWGPIDALRDNACNDQQGLTSRIFQRLFARIIEEQIKHADKQLKYQCRCSFLEIYNEQITDLLEPSQRNLQIREDLKSGVFVENLKEDFVLSVKDVNRLLIKGLCNRRTGSTCLNAQSSRSHSVFTCIVESRSKSTADGISCLKTSRINLVDLAGSERQRLTGAVGERLKESGNINRSLSQLGNLINILAEISQSGKQRHVPYRDSRLTFLLQDSLGGNAKLAIVCAISPAQSCKSETVTTLRFAQRAKAIKNRAVVNEEMEDDVNHLKELIRQLRDEICHMKANSNKKTSHDPRKSLILLKSIINPHQGLFQVDDDGDVEMEIDEQTVEKLCMQVSLKAGGVEDKSAAALKGNDCGDSCEGKAEVAEHVDPDPKKPCGASLDGSDDEDACKKQFQGKGVVDASESNLQQLSSTCTKDLHVQKVNVGVQTCEDSNESPERDIGTLLCTSCRRMLQPEVDAIDCNKDLQLVPVDRWVPVQQVEGVFSADSSKLPVLES